MIFTNEIKNNEYSTINPKRVVCAVPSLTEMLHYFDLDKEVVGITKFCVHPQQWYRRKKRVGGTKQLKRDVIHSLSPDLIIANIEENTKEDLVDWPDALVWVTEVKRMKDLFDLIRSFGFLFDRKALANHLIRTIQEKQNTYQRIRNAMQWNTVIYLIWWDPIMTVGGDTFIHTMLSEAGLSNLSEDQERYPTLTYDELKEYNPDFVFLSSEPFRFKDKHKAKLQELLPQSTILFVDGEMFSWYGSRVCQAFDYFEKDLLPKMRPR